MWEDLEKFIGKNMKKNSSLSFVLFRLIFAKILSSGDFGNREKWL